MKKEKLLKALKTSVALLESGTVNYYWYQPMSCNCGIVAQTIMGATPNNLKLMLPTDKLKELYDNDLHLSSPTWSNMVYNFCPVTGEPLYDVFKILDNNGLSRIEIGHLEFLSDKKILERAKINTAKKYNGLAPKKVKKEIKEGGFLGFFKTKKIIEVGEITQSSNVPYYAAQSNLIAYLKAWIEILEEELSNKKSSGVISDTDADDQSCSIENLKEEKHQAIVNQDYERAAILRDKLSRIEKDSL